MIKYWLDASRNPNVILKFEKKSDDASGYDLMANLSTSRILEQGRRWIVPIGLYLEMPRGIEAQIRTRSGLARDHGVVVLNAPGTIDADYRGEIGVNLVNFGEGDYTIIPGERIAQIVFSRVVGLDMTDIEQSVAKHAYNRDPQRVADKSMLNVTRRGEMGHGSTGR